ncbi:hypothetical protein HYW42_01370 [Candidatus Daviesbacteria bacterium]|nr:hypothetical protein [Candidatus Daviesbacteria bacterium]
MRRFHLILTGLSLNIILLSLNRLTEFTQGYLQPFEFLRWLDFNAMLPIPLLSVLLYYLLRKEVLYDSPFSKSTLYIILALIFIAGVYFFGAGSGDHEVTNYLNSRFCQAGRVDSPICNIISFNDDQFSHYVYYLGFVLLNISLMFLEHFYPRKDSVFKIDLILIVANSLFIAAGIFANLAFEEAVIDLVVFSSVMILALYLLIFTQRKLTWLPVTFYFALSYTLGVLATLLYKLSNLF